MRAHLDAGRRPCLAAPTGAGKSVMSNAILEGSKSALCIVHTRTLLEQSRRTIPNASVATVQGLVVAGQNGDRKRSALGAITDVFIDECHHIVSEDWRQAVPLLAHARLFGATATPERADGSPLGDVFDALVVAERYSALVQSGHLVPCDVLAPEISRRDQKKKKIKSDAVKAYLENAKRADGTWRPGIYFDRTIIECDDACHRFCAAGVRGRLVTKDTSTDERQGIFDAYTRGDLDMLCSPQALAEGFDSPRAEVCVLNRSAAHVGGFLQMVGRVLRPCAGKERALLIDNTDATSVHGMPTADRVYSLEGKGIELAPEEGEESEELGDPVEREYAQVVQMKFKMLRDKLRDIYVDLTDQAKENQYKLGWVFHRFAEKTGIQPPRAFEAKFASVCKVCRHRLKVGEPMLWNGPGAVYHHACWFESIQENQLLTADDMQPPAQRLLDMVRREPADDIPF